MNESEVHIDEITKADRREVGEVPVSSPPLIARSPLKTASTDLPAMQDLHFDCERNENKLDGSLAEDEQATVDLEIRLLLQAIHERYNFNFQEYAFPSIRRRILSAVAMEGLQSVSEFQGRILRDEVLFEQLLKRLSLHVTTMFRDSSFYESLRCVILPALANEPFLRIWHAGCATGEEVYSVAILLHELGLLERTRIYATDLSHAVLRRARNGIYSETALEEYARNYHSSGGERNLNEYFTSSYGHGIVRTFLKKNIVFSQHDLASDHPFNEFHLIFVRNVLIYFGKDLQQRVIRLLDKSLQIGGLLLLGTRESLRYSVIESDYRREFEEEVVYRKLR